jgi:hypothetical protein
MPDGENCAVCGGPDSGAMHIKNKHGRYCVWNCGRKTPRRSRICDQCWNDREALYARRKAKATEGSNAALNKQYGLNTPISDGSRR